MCKKSIIIAQMAMLPADGGDYESLHGLLGEPHQELEKQGAAGSASLS